MKLVASFFILLMFFACGEPDDDITEACNETVEKQHRLSEELLNYFPSDYLNTLTDIVLYNQTGDSLVLKAGGKRSDFYMQSSEKPCGNNGVNIYNASLESLNVLFTSEAYNLNVGGNLRLNIDFTGTVLGSEPITLTPMDYDSCYTESFSCTFTIKDVNNFNSIFENTKNSNCSTSNIPEVIDPLDVFSSLELNGKTFSDVLVNINTGSANFVRIYYNKTYGFLGFEEKGEVWIIKP